MTALVPPHQRHLLFPAEFEMSGCDLITTIVNAFVGIIPTLFSEVITQLFAGLTGSP